MFVFYKDVKVYYEIVGDGDLNLVYLHGWGENVSFFKYFANNIYAKNILIDFPPFGKSESLKQPFCVKDYANIVKLVLDTNKIYSFSIISHSFGTRVAIYLCNLYNKNVNKLVITGGAGLKPKNKIKKALRKLKYKIVKTFNKNAKVGSNDYKNLSPIMKKTFNNIVNEDLTTLASKILVKTLIIYGNKDKETPLYMAKKFNKIIKNSKLIVYKNCNHFAYLQQKDKFLLDVLVFLKD